MCNIGEERRVSGRGDASRAHELKGSASECVGDEELTAKMITAHSCNRKRLEQVWIEALADMKKSSSINIVLRTDGEPSLCRLT